MQRLRIAWWLALLAVPLALAAPPAKPAFDTSVITAQRKLDALGYLPGNWDGIVGPKTRAALRLFQGDHLLTQSGDLDDATRRQLGLQGDAAIPAVAHLAKLQDFLRRQGTFTYTSDGLMGRLTWQALQTYLANQGYYQGKADGLAGPRTRDAIKRWQTRLHVPTTGLLDTYTVAALEPAAPAPAPTQPAK